MCWLCTLVALQRLLWCWQVRPYLPFVYHTLCSLEFPLLAILPSPNQLIARLQNYSFAGIGSQLHVYSASSGALLLCETVFSNGNRLHGVSSTATEHGALLILHGDRLAQARFTCLR